MTSIYVHFPWCLAKCPYCDFVSYATDPSTIDHVAYADAVIAEAEARAEGVSEISSIFFGGGTPSLWSSTELGRVLARFRAIFQTTNALEVTVECNPTSLDRDRARALSDVGVNRLSIGTQSLRADQLKFLGRLHDPDGARKAITGALESGIPRVSADLIFGLPEQTPEDAADQARSLAGLGLKHLSCYQLTIEPGTQFGERKKRGLLPMADDAVVADGFLAVDAALGACGFTHYEISNYAFPGEEARHNMAYWRGDPYLGLGCAAYGMMRTASGGLRYRNQVDPKKYLVERARSMSEETLSPEELLRERIMLGLRLAVGMNLTEAGAACGLDPWTSERLATIEKQVARGRLLREGDILRIPREAWLFTDDIASRLF